MMGGMSQVKLQRVAGNDFPLFSELQHQGPHGFAEVHTHDAVEVVYVVRGGGVNIVDGRPYPIMRGDLYVIDVDSTHAFSTEGALDIYNLLFKSSLYTTAELDELRALPHFSSFFLGHERGSNKERPKLTFTPPLSETIERTLERLTAEFAEQRPGYRQLAKALFTELVITVCRSHGAGSEIAGTIDDGPVARAINFLHQHYADRLTVEDLASLTGLSTGYFGELFKQHTGQTVHHYLTKLRVDRARALLAESELSVTAICHRTGFEDGGYFAKVFKREVGVSPRDYRKK
jgi:AraC-like DNA-binding protein